MEKIGTAYGNVAKSFRVTKINGFGAYRGTYVQNIALIQLAKAGKLRKVWLIAHFALNCKNFLKML